MRFTRLAWLALLATSSTSTPTTNSSSALHSFQKRSSAHEDIEEWANPTVLPIYVYRVYRGFWFQFNVYGMNEVKNTHGVWRMRSHFGPNAEELRKALNVRVKVSKWSFKNISHPKAIWRRGYEWELHWHASVFEDNAYWVDIFAALHAPIDWVLGTRPNLLERFLSWPGPLIGRKQAAITEAPFDQCHTTFFDDYDRCKAHEARGCNMPWGSCRDAGNILQWVHPKFHGSCTTCPDPDLVQFKEGIESLWRDRRLNNREVDKLRGLHGMSDLELAKVGMGDKVPGRHDLIVGGTRTLVDDLNVVLRHYRMRPVVLAKYGSHYYK
jgi:hypothetical protein